MWSLSFFETIGCFFAGIYAVAIYMMFATMEPYSYYLPGGIGKFYKVHKNITTKYYDVIGCDDLKKEVIDTINIFKNEKENRKYTLLFRGKTGTGKTHMARAIAGECNLPFVEILSGEFSRKNNPVVINSVIKIHAPCIIFIDECHSILSYNSEYMLRMLDGIDNKNMKVFFIFATNNSDDISNAAMRKGRIDKIIDFDIPSKNEKLLHVINTFPFLSPDQATDISEKLGNVSQAEFGFMKREYDFIQKRHFLNGVTCPNPMKDICYLIEKLQMGYHTQKHIINDEESYRIAIHEIGHAFTAFMLKSSEKPTKITLKQAGNFLGYNIINFDNVVVHTKQKLHAAVMVYYAGYVAEKFFFNDDTSSLIMGDIDTIKTIVDRMSSSLMLKDFGGKPKSSGLIPMLGWNEDYMEKVEEFLNKNIFVPYSEDIKRIANMLVKDRTFEDKEVLQSIFGPYVNKIKKIDFPIN